MRTVILVGAGQFGRNSWKLINRNQYEVLAFADNNPHLQNSTLYGIPVLSLEDACAKRPDLYLITVSGEERITSLTQQLLTIQPDAKWYSMMDFCALFSVRDATLNRIADVLKERNIFGDLAELGVFQGDFAWQLNAFFPDRNLHLFDTFEGFHPNDTSIEKESAYSNPDAQDFSLTSVDAVVNRMIVPENVVLHPGYFPDTTKGWEFLQFSLVSLDADLYQPTLEGLRYFYPRLSSGGMIVVHDYDSTQYQGVKNAVLEYEKEVGTLCLVPLCDLHGTVLIVKGM